MDPLTALTNLVTALTKFAETIVEGQTPEQRKQIWDWYIEDVKRWRKMFKLDSE